MGADMQVSLQFLSTKALKDDATGDWYMASMCKAYCTAFVEHNAELVQRITEGVQSVCRASAQYVQSVCKACGELVQSVSRAIVERVQSGKNDTL